MQMFPLFTNHLGSCSSKYFFPFYVDKIQIYGFLFSISVLFLTYDFVFLRNWNHSKNSKQYCVYIIRLLSKVYKLQNVTLLCSDSVLRILLSNASDQLINPSGLFIYCSWLYNTSSRSLLVLCKLQFFATRCEIEPSLQLFLISALECYVSENICFLLLKKIPMCPKCLPYLSSQGVEVI